MPRPGAFAEGTEGGLLLRNNYINWRSTSRKPVGPGIGSVDHYNSRTIYKELASKSGFRNAAIKAAAEVASKMSEEEISEMNNPLYSQSVDKRLSRAYKTANPTNKKNPNKKNGVDSSLFVDYNDSED